MEEAAKSQRGAIEGFINKQSVATMPSICTTHAQSVQMAELSSMNEDCKATEREYPTNKEIVTDEQEQQSCETTCEVKDLQQSPSTDQPLVPPIANIALACPPCDPALWSVNDSMITYWLQMGPESCRNRDKIYANSIRQCKDTSRTSRRLCDSAFFTLSPNGEISPRKWLLYSPTTGRLFCFVCKLFAHNSVSVLASTGFDSWNHITRLGDHERSTDHRQALTTYTTRLYKSNTIDRSIADDMENQKMYWREVLRRVVSTIKFLTSRGLALRGGNEIFGSSDNGNFLGCLEYLAEYDPFIAVHIGKHENAGRGTPSYLSSTIYEEIITLMADKIRKVIADELKTAKYFSFTVDSTPDITHTDQLTFTVRYVKSDGVPVERFLKFVPITSHTGLHIFEVIMETFRDHNINVNECIGQTYDNASNMSGMYSGVQARIVEVNRKAVYVPCMTHSLNLSGVTAAESCNEAVSYFGFVQKIYVFLSSSTYRWKLLTDALAAKSNESKSSTLVPKNLSGTRWSARADALRSLSLHYEIYKSLFQSISNDPLQKKDTRTEALALVKTMQKLETAFLTTFWNAALNRINETSKLLQSESIAFSTAVALLKSLSEYLAAQRNSFEQFRQTASTLSNANFQEKRPCRPKRAADDSDEPAVIFSGEEKFKIETFFVIIDALVSDLQRRVKAYSDIEKRFAFLTADCNSSDAKDSLQELLNFYPDDVNEEIFDEWLQWNSFLKQLPSTSTACLNQPLEPAKMLTTMKTLNLETGFPNVYIALRIYLSLQVSNCSGERSFSHLKRVKNALRSTMGHRRVADLALLNIECEIVGELDFHDIIESFSASKARRKDF